VGSFVKNYEINNYHVVLPRLIVSNNSTRQKYYGKSVLNTVMDSQLEMVVLRCCNCIIISINSVSSG